MKAENGFLYFACDGCGLYKGEHLPNCTLLPRAPLAVHGIKEVLSVTRHGDIEITVKRVSP